MENAKAEVRQAAETAVLRATFRVQTTAKRKIQRGPASGEVYDISGPPQRTHQASAPGEPPMSDTGRLASSIENRVDGLTGYVFTRVKYGNHLEFGTRKMAARPWLFPSVEENAAQFRRDLMEILK